MRRPSLTQILFFDCGEPREFAEVSGRHCLVGKRRASVRSSECKVRFLLRAPLEVCSIDHVMIPFRYMGNERARQVHPLLANSLLTVLRTGTNDRRRSQHNSYELETQRRFRRVYRTVVFGRKLIGRLESALGRKLPLATTMFPSSGDRAAPSRVYYGRVQAHQVPGMGARDGAFARSCAALSGASQRVTLPVRSASACGIAAFQGPLMLGLGGKVMRVASFLTDGAHHNGRRGRNRSRRTSPSIM